MSTRSARLVVALGLAALAALPGAARAQLYDPAFRWRTLETPHFRVHFHQGEETLAQDVAREAERAHAWLTPLLREPGRGPHARTEVVLSDDTDQANGSASPLPYNTMRLFAVPPDHLSELSDYRDWLATLVFHEYVHILHMDEIGGLPAGLNALFGRVFVPNGFVPPWMLEGLAVLHENDTAAPGAGRNASALHDMYARALATSRPFPRLDEASNPFLEWPTGDVPYLLGGRFMHWLQAHFGDDRIRGFLADQGRQLWPWAPSWAAERWFGEDFPTLWARYAAAETERARLRLEGIRASPVTAATRLTTAGGRVTTPRWSPDGASLVYTRRSLDRRPGVFRVAPDGHDLRRVADIEQNGALAIRSPREAVVAAGQVWREHRIYDDLWLLDLGTGARRRLTDGARATDPALGPGDRLVFVRRLPGGELALVRRPLAEARDERAEEVLFARRGAQVFAPAVSPDGEAVAFELHEGGRRDLALWRAGSVTRLTDDDALDTSPAWTPDGRWLLFASDRGGVFNLYAWEAASGAVRQVTNVEQGAFQPAPSPDGKTLAFVSFSRDGFDLSTIPLEPTAWREAPAAAPVVAPAPASASAPATAVPASPPPQGPAPASPPAAAPDLASRPYRALDTLAPTFWLPVLGADGAGSIYGALTGGSDVLARHAWSLQAWWSPKAETAGYVAAYAGGWSWPTVDATSSRFTDTADGGTKGLVNVWTPLDTGATFTFTRLERALALRLGWSGTIYDVVGERRTATRPERVGLADAFLSEVSVQATYSDARRFFRSISPEEGRTLTVSGRLAAPGLGSDVRLSRARAAGVQYLRVPFTSHAVLAVRASGGLAEGSLQLTSPFRLGGVVSGDPLALLTGAATAGGDSLRGYPSGEFRGTGFVLGNLELRFPIAAPGRGYSTWPLFLRRLHGAVFADLGETFDRPGELPWAGHGLAGDRLRLGAGAELRAEVVLGYSLVTDVRLGVARAFGRVFAGASGEPGAGDVQVFLTIGPSF